MSIFEKVTSYDMFKSVMQDPALLRERNNKFQGELRVLGYKRGITYILPEKQLHIWEARLVIEAHISIPELLKESKYGWVGNVLLTAVVLNAYLFLVYIFFSVWS